MWNSRASSKGSWLLGGLLCSLLVPALPEAKTHPITLGRYQCRCIEEVQGPMHQGTLMWILGPRVLSRHSFIHEDTMELGVQDERVPWARAAAAVPSLAVDSHEKP